MHYILENKIPKRVSLRKWAEWFSENDRIVKQEHIGDIFISTVFLGLDHNHWGGNPHLFETMVFDENDNDIYCTRCSSWDEAEKMHEDAIQWVNDGCKDD